MVAVAAVPSLGCRADGPTPRATAASASHTPAADRAPAGPPAATPSSAPTASPSASSTRAVVQVPDSRWLRKMLIDSDKRFAKWLARAEPLRFQLLVTELRQGDAGPTLKHHGLRVDAEYVYPASAIKPFMAVAALHQLAKLGKRHDATIDRRTPIWRCREGTGRCEVYREDKETKDHDGGFSAGAEIRKLLRYSDNDSYGRLHDFVGHREANALVASFGFPSVRLHHTMGKNAELSRKTPRIVLKPRGGEPLTFEARESDVQLLPTPAAGLDLGKGYIDEKSKRVREPMSFASKNYASLRDMQRLTIALLRPELAPDVKLGLSDDQRAFVIKQLGAIQEHLPERHKPLLPGVRGVIGDKHLRYVGKSGRAYGFHLENAFIGLRDGSRGFFVAVSVYANPNGVLNDDRYGYNQTSFPLLAALGKALARALLRDAPPAAPPGDDPGTAKRTGKAVDAR
jgi:hypothetical protein